MMVSIIIVNYHVKKELFACIESIFLSKTKVALDVIVVDNDEDKKISVDLKKKFPNVAYISNENNGFGEGNNVGARKARGEVLFFLNPDTIVGSGGIDALVAFLQKKKDVGIVAPLLLGTDGKAYQQGSLMLTPKRGVFALSFLNKIFPKNPVSKEYYLSDWDRKSLKEVDVVPGTAFVIRREIFEKVGGFDEKFFLYFEEFDLCKRVKELGWKIFILPTAKVTHAWGSSTKKSDKNIQKIFDQSRFYYFKKHFGLLSALFTESFLQIGKTTVLLVSILLVGLFLRLHNIESSMPFIGDQGWFYLSARDMVLTGTTPLVGIASSHPWLHQGAFWTYMLALGFQMSDFSPFVGGYISIFLGLLGILGMYGVGRELFSKRVGLIAAAFFATSPLIVASDRMPYHTSPIPLFTIIFIYCLYKWVSGNVRYFPAVIASLAILYNFELATALLGMVTIAIWFYGCMVKKGWALGVLRFKFLVLRLIAYAISMLPMIIYDFGHGFAQTLGFAAWLGYKVLVMFGYPALSHTVSTPLVAVGAFFVEQVRELVFGYSGWAAIAIMVGSIGYLSVAFLRKKPHPNPSTPVKQAASLRPALKGEGTPMRLVLVLNIVLILGFFVARTPSGAYLPMMFPGILLMVGVCIGRGIDNKIRLVRVIWGVGVIAVVCLNSYYSFSQSASGNSFAKQLEAAKYIVKEASGKEYNLIGRGEGSQFESFTMNYEYLTWWMGKGPAKTEKPLQFIISEDAGGVRVEKRDGR